MKHPALLRSLSLSLSLGVLLLLAGCGERGDKAIAYGDGLGQDWKPTASKQMRIAIDNNFTRDVTVEADAPGAHYEMTVGPIRQRYMIVPEADYKVEAYTEERSTGIMKLYSQGDDRNGAKGLWLRIRP